MIANPRAGASERPEIIQLPKKATNEGLAIAKRLQGADYDLDEVTPDADNWKYAPMF